jgi:hypothetical protein
MRKCTAVIVAAFAVMALAAVGSGIDWPSGTMSTTAMAAPAGGDVTPQTSSTGGIDWP